MNLKKIYKFLLIANLLGSFYFFENCKAEVNNESNLTKEKVNLTIDYLDSRGELEDYIIDTGDKLYIDFLYAKELNGRFLVNPEGEILLPRIGKTFVRGLTTYELDKLLNEKYLDFLISPKIETRIVGFKSIRVVLTGEITNPGFYNFSPSINNTSLIEEKEEKKSDLPFQEIISLNKESNGQSFEFDVKNDSINKVTISKAILAAGGITKDSDLKRIEVIRDVPLSKGGGKKRAIIDLTQLLSFSNQENNIRLFDGDRLIVPKLSESSIEQIPKSILTGISPKFINVEVFGYVESPGQVRLPLQASLSDAIDLSGPIKPLSGNVILIRYLRDGTVLKKKINYSSNAIKGSKRNPFLKKDDLISVRDSLLGKTSGVVTKILEPVVGIYAGKALFFD